MKLNTILVAVDFSDEADIAIQQALGIARMHGARLVLLHVGSVPERPIGVPATMHTTVAEYLRLAEQDLAHDRARLGEIRERISGQGVDISHMVIDGVPQRGICDAADEIGADLIVTGSHGRTGIKRFLLGSVAERVVRHSKRHVMIARKSEHAAGGFHRILVATDFSNNAELALSAALTVAAKDAAIDVVHCWHLPPMSYPYYAPTKAAKDLVTTLRDSAAEGVNKLGAELIERHQRQDVTLGFHQREASPAHGIQDQLEQGYELVVTGSHGRSGAARILLGSVAEFTVRHSPCSVLVIHGKSEATAEPASEANES